MSWRSATTAVGSWAVIVYVTLATIPILFASVVWTAATPMPKRRVPTMRPGAIFRGNCVWWVLHTWLTCGGWIHIRRSLYARMPHFMWSNTYRGARWEFVPMHPRTDWLAPFHAVWHKGIVRQVG